MKRTTAHILADLKTLIEALTPPTSDGSDDDLYRVQIGDRYAMTGGRVVLLSGTGGARMFTGGATCVDWDTTITVTQILPDLPVEDGDWGAAQVAIDDAETILDAILAWSISTDGIVKVESDQAQLGPTEGNAIQMVRTLQIRYLREDV